MGFWDGLDNLLNGEEKRESEERMQQNEHEHLERMENSRRQEAEFRARLEHEAEAEKRQMRAREIREKLASEERKTRIENEAKRYTAKVENEAKVNIANIKKTMQEKAEVENTRRTQIAEAEATRRAEQVEETKRIESADRRATAFREFEYKEAAGKELARMFATYMATISDVYQKELEFLYKDNVDRRQSYLISEAKARDEKEHILELSKDARGQEKLDYLNKLDDLEETIRQLQDNEAKAENDMKAKLSIIKYKQSQDMERHQNMLDTQTFLLNSTGEEHAQ